MTRDEAVACAVDALGYALENDTDYLSAEVVATWTEALDTLTTTPERPDAQIGA